MKKLMIVFGCLMLVLVFSSHVMAGKGGVKGSNNSNVVCTTIQDGVLTYSPGHYLYGQPIPTGYDPYGYNYQAHMFNGSYANTYFAREGFPPYDGDDATYLASNPSAETKWYWAYRDVDLMMKWNDAWLSNKDCNADGSLDRSSPYIGSGAWITNHMSGTYNKCKWVYFTKIVAVPADANRVGLGDGGTWYAADGTEIGISIWGSFATIQTVENDPCAGINGKQYGSPVGPGFGKFKP
jgi:hypothetical protein